MRLEHLEREDEEKRKKEEFEQKVAGNKREAEVITTPFLNIYVPSSFNNKQISFFRREWRRMLRKEKRKN